MHIVRKFLLKCLFLGQTLRNVSWLSKFVLMFEPLKIVIMNILPVIVFALTKSWVCSTGSLRVLGQESLVEFLLSHTEDLRALRRVDTAVQKISDKSSTSTPSACIVHSIQWALKHLHLIIDVQPLAPELRLAVSNMLDSEGRLRPPSIIIIELELCRGHSRLSKSRLVLKSNGDTTGIIEVQSSWSIIGRLHRISSLAAGVGSMRISAFHY